MTGILKIWFRHFDKLLLRVNEAKKTNNYI